MKKKRFLSILLSLVLVLGMLPGMSLTAFADDNSTTTITPGTDDAKTGTGQMTITLTIAAAAQEANADLRKAIVDFFTPFYYEFVKELIQGDSWGGNPVRGSVSATYNGENADIAYSPTSENSGDITISHGGNELRFYVSIETDPETGNNTTVVGPVTYTGDEPTAFSLSFDPAAIDLDGSVRTSVYPAPVAVTSVTLDPSTAQTIDVDGTVSFTATIAPDNATDKTVKWSVGGTDTGAVTLYTDADCTSDNEVGTEATETLTVYAKGISAGSATITATSNADSTKSASCDVTVTDPLADAKTSAKADLDTLLTGKNQNDYDAADWTTLTQAITDGKTAIDNATTTEAVTTAKNTAIDAVNAVKTKAQKALENAKTTAKNDLDTLQREIHSSLHWLRCR